MNWMDFGTRMFAALLPGGAIGLERQWRQRMTGLRTNGLVAVGSAMFVMMGGTIAREGSQGRVAAYVVSGIGFLGGGAILKDGFNIRGMNTAATLWCTTWEVVAAVDAEDASMSSTEELVGALSPRS